MMELLFGIAVYGIVILFGTLWIFCGLEPGRRRRRVAAVWFGFLLAATAVGSALLSIARP